MDADAVGRVQVAVLGAPEVVRDGAVVTFDTRKATALLSYLVVEARPVRREALATLLWPDASRERAAAALRRTLSVLRSGVGAGALVVERDLVALGAEAASDLTTARALLASRAGHGHPADDVCAACVDVLAEAARHHRGSFLEGFTLRDSDRFDDWRFFTAEELSRELAGLLERLARALVLTGDLDSALTAARRWLALDPLQEAAHALLVRLYDWTGRRSAALRQYRECVRLLDAELGVPPLEETTATYQAVLERRLRPPSLPAPASPRPSPRAASARSGPAAVPFMDRVAERTAVVEALAAPDDRGRLVVVEGEAGIGKSRLVAEALRDPRLAGRRVVRARSHDGESELAYALVADLLRAGLTPAVVERLGATVRAEIARLLPELGDGTGLPPLDSPGAQSRFSGALADTVAAAVAGGAGGVRAGVLCLEDLQWADPASIDFLAYLARRLPEGPLRIVVTWRTERVGRWTPLRRLLATARRDGTATGVTLHRLAADDLAPVVQGDADLAARVLAATEGLPLLVVEYLAALEDGAAPPDALPGGARDLLAGRVDGVSETADRVLAAAAVVGRDLQPELVRAASGRSEEEVAVALEELVAAGILVEVAGDAPGYEFAHGQLRAIAYEGIGLARRRLLHRRTAEALGARDRRRGVLEAGAAEVARHHRLAGQDDAAAIWEAVAGDRARALLALDEAAAHYARALALGHPDPARIHVALGDVSLLAGRYGEARAAFETAAAFADPGDVAAVERRLGEVSARLGDWGLADSHYEAALAADPAPPLRARVLADRALVAHRAGNAGPARANAEAALETAEAAGDEGARAQVLNVLGLLEAAAGLADRAEARLAESLALARRLGDPAAEIAAANNLARTLRARGATEEALALACGALAVRGCRRPAPRGRPALQRRGPPPRPGTARRGGRAPAPRGGDPGGRW